MLLDYTETESGVMQLSSTCSSMFNVQGNTIYLIPGDNLNLANLLCPAGSYYMITSGTYYSQSVTNPKNGNTWVGQGSPKLNGQLYTDNAFWGEMDNNTFSWFEINNYELWGIHSDHAYVVASNVEIKNMTFKNIGNGKHGQYYGAIHFKNAEDVEVKDSYFEKVASSIRFINSEGPIKVLNNEALNTGRNFFQCIECTGGNIRINGNSLEHTQKYGSEPLEDFINIFESEGLSTDYIQVNNNRARTNATGSGVSVNGSFIILGDDGGKYQEAKNNIGVNTGNAGIGASGGQYIRVNNNKMYSTAILNLSNVGFYSYRVLGNDPCSNHTFSGNVANWDCYRSDCSGQTPPVVVKNKAHAKQSASDPDYCGLTWNQIRDNSRVSQDLSMGPEIWDTW